ncbi:4-hydroxybenzoate polyprenyltransferase, mitochondrial-like isoform X2 [Gigantopelta aegis]|uniref:4-hydroxybenzoate polyprenyltransferase, mitochondrial-like isoform X2 n=1 Tax=Gigantopelta aegis TaxID=1735272 RepID=UPI001B88D907|nr:4-hydroxybenzoate polyprenyltransferase, mitochondrial-like isoform X2 [Gigantopelta aegis]
MLVKSCRIVSCSKPCHLSLKYLSALSSNRRSKHPSTLYRKDNNLPAVTETSSLDTGTGTCLGIVHQMKNEPGIVYTGIYSEKVTPSIPTVSKCGLRPLYDSTSSLDSYNGVPHCRFYHSLGKKMLMGHPLLSTEVFQRDGSKKLSMSLKSILDASPPSIQPYLKLIRFDKPIGSYLLFWPCAWSIGIAADPGHLPDLYMLMLFAAGAFFMRGSGCIINDMWDKDFDKKVERTKLRPLASGEITHFQALVFLGSQLGLALAILLQLNTYSILLGASSMGLVIAYPLAKRFTNWPQVMLGVTLNWGVLLSWSALKGSLDCTVLPLYLACVVYTIFYDSIYSHQDKYDDMLIGVKSSALALGDKTKPVLTVFASIMIGGLSLTGYLSDQTWPFYAAVATTAAHLSHQLYTVNLDDADDCATKFRSNIHVGMLMFLGVVLGTLMKNPANTVKPDINEEDKTEKLKI